MAHVAVGVMDTRAQGLPMCAQLSRVRVHFSLPVYEPTALDAPSYSFDCKRFTTSATVRSPSSLANCAE